MIDVTEAAAATTGFFAAFGAFRVSAQREMREQVKVLTADNERLSKRYLQLEAQMELILKERTQLQVQLVQLLSTKQGA